MNLDVVLHLDQFFTSRNEHQPNHEIRPGRAELGRVGRLPFLTLSFKEN